MLVKNILIFESLLGEYYGTINLHLGFIRVNATLTDSWIFN